MRLLALFQAKSIEFGTSSNMRIYCPNPRCSTFLTPLRDSSDVMCTRCQITVCTSCKERAHPGEDCAIAASTLQVRLLAKSRGWQTCPGCNGIVELSQGCFHITCRCKEEFCYLCAVRWKHCTCPQWDEDRLVDAAEHRVLNEFGHAAAAAAPALHAERVQRRVAHLRTHHRCMHDVWKHRHGGGECEECGDDLPTFLKVCSFLFSHCRITIHPISDSDVPIVKCWLACGALAIVYRK